MKYLFLFFFLSVIAQANAQTRYDVASTTEFYAAHDQATPGDSIVWAPGNYSNIRLDIDTDGLIITAEQYGTVLFSGVSRVVINADDVTFSGFQYIGGYIGNLDVIRVYGSDILITHVNIQNYTSHKYLVVYAESRNTTISHCNFENRINLDDKNILSILVDEEPGYHKIQYCSFKNFEGIGLDEGIEPIRIGVSTQGNLDSRTLVEYCYFTRCNGDGEIISHKSRQNVYRYNTFENNPVSELVLRHGDEGIIYGNFFLNNMGGIRVREGSDHFIFNNYFEGLDRRSIYLMNDPSDPLSNIGIYHNTFIHSEELRLGGFGSNPPTDVVFANNVFTNPTGKLVDEDTGTETWIGNISFGNLGIDVPSTGISDMDPKFQENVEGFFQPEVTSPVIASASNGYPTIPLYPGMDYDHEILFDLMKTSRPAFQVDKAIGASEFSSTVNVKPHVDEMNTGPSYLFDNVIDYLTANASQFYVGEEEESKTLVISSNLDWEVMSSAGWISTDLSSGAGNSQLNIMIEANPVNQNRSGLLTITAGAEVVNIEIFQDAGETVSTIDYQESEIFLFPNPTNGVFKIKKLPSGVYRLKTEITDLKGRNIFSEEYQIDNNELEIDVDQLISGAYIINIKFIRSDGTVQRELTRKFIRN